MGKGGKKGGLTASSQNPRSTRYQCSLIVLTSFAPTASASSSHTSATIVLDSRMSLAATFPYFLPILLKICAGCWNPKPSTSQYGHKSPAHKMLSGTNLILNSMEITRNGLSGFSAHCVTMVGEVFSRK